MSDLPLFDVPPERRFDGSTYDATRDCSRLSGSLLRIYEAMKDGRWRTIAELARAGGCTEAAASARARDLRKPKFGSHTVERKSMGGGHFVYRLAV